ncbi:MAG: LysM peptidoglycan-binding domain-containing protein [Prevotellaceae bacterium]|jgi:hypothetical protein|nr:LysM peptidoglycan-binding domain-containing protein [Prevotellaceae bacterium]
MTITALTNQSIYDLAVQVLGTADGAMALALANDLAATDNLVPGQVLTIPTNWREVATKQIADYYEAKKLKPATGTTGDSLPGGINYMGIEINFIVS